MIQKAKVQLQMGRHASVEVSPRLLGGAWGRKLYRVEPGFCFSIPSDGLAHSHGSPDYLIPVGGSITLAYLKPSGVVEELQLEPGYHYTIPPNIPHQVVVSGGMLESIFPSIVFENGIPMRKFKPFINLDQKSEDVPNE